MLRRWTLVIGITWFLDQSSGIAIDNEILGEPHLDCMPTGIRLRVTTRNPFIGRIFVKGESHVPECSSEAAYTGAHPGDFPRENSDPLFSLSFDRCGMYRLRMLNPKGMMYSSTVIVSFHPIFVTKVDRAYKIECFYGEVERTLNAQFNVSMLPTTALNDRSTMPTCQYTVRSQTLDGPVVRFAKVGEPVVHRWECSSDMYGFLVKDCYVENGNAERFEVIDARGCALDPVLITHVNYDRTAPLAFAESHVFKFADVSRLNFQCQIQICLKMEGGCNNITPPNCQLPLEPQRGPAPLRSTPGPQGLSSPRGPPYRRTPSTRLPPPPRGHPRAPLPGSGIVDLPAPPRIGRRRRRRSAAAASPPPRFVRIKERTSPRTTTATDDELDVRNHIIVFDLDDADDQQQLHFDDLLRRNGDGGRAPPSATKGGVKQEAECLIGGLGAIAIVVCLIFAVVLLLITLISVRRRGNRDYKLDDLSVR